MAIRSPIGGGNLGELFALGTNAFGTKQAHVEDHTKSTKTTGHPNKKNIVIDLDAQHADSNFETFLTTYLVSQDLSLIKDDYEDASEESSSPATASQAFGYILYFGVLGTNRKVLYGVGVLTGNTGEYSTANKQFEKTPVQISGIPAPATYSIPATLFNTGKVSSATTISLAKDSYGAYAFITAA